MESILIVDDEPDILSSLSDVLSRPGLNIQAALSGLDALTIMKQGPIRLIITDYRMPGMDGLEFARLARQAQPGVPIIMITAYPDPLLAARALTEFGIGLMVAKPFELEYLLAVVGSVLAAPEKASPRPQAG